MAIPGLQLPRAGDSGGTSTSRSSDFNGLAERMNEFRKKKRKEEDDAKAATQATEDKRKADEKAAADKAAEDKKKSLPERIKRGIADVFQADSEADKKRRTDSGQPALYDDQQAQKKATADAFKGKTADEFNRADDGLNLSQDELEKRRSHYKDSGIDIDQLRKDKSEYDALQARRAKGESLVKLTKEGAITDGAKRYEFEKPKVAKAESTYQRNLKAEAGAESGIEQAERGFVRGMGSPLIQLPSNLETIAGSAIKAVAPDGSRLQKTGEKVYEKGTLDRDALKQSIATSGYAPQAADNPTISAFSEGAGSLAASLTAAKLARGATVAPAAVFGINQGTDQAVASEKAGKSDVQSLVTGVVGGTAEAALEKFGLDKFLGASGGVVKEAATRMITEGSQEAMQSLAQSGVSATYSHVDVQQAIQQAITEGGIGAIIGGGASLPMSIAENLQKQGVDPNTALEIGMNVQDRMELVANEEKAKVSGDQPKDKDAATTPELPESGVLPTDPTMDGVVAPEPPSEAPAENVLSQDPQLKQALQAAAAVKTSAAPRAGTDHLETPSGQSADVAPAGSQSVSTTAAGSSVSSPKPKYAIAESTDSKTQSTKENVESNTHAVEAVKQVAKPNPHNIIDRKNFGTYATDAKYLAVEYVDAVDDGDLDKADRISNRVAEMPVVGAPALIKKLYAYRDSQASAAQPSEASSAAAGSGTGTDVRVGEKSRAPVAGGATITSNETSKDTSPINQRTADTTAGSYDDASKTAEGQNTDGERSRQSADVRRRSDDGHETDTSNGGKGSSETISQSKTQGQSLDELHEQNQNSSQTVTGTSKSRAGTHDKTQRHDAKQVGVGTAAANNSSPTGRSADGKGAAADNAESGATDQSDSRRQTLKALEDHKALSEGRTSERPAAELAKLADQLNKAAQAGAILRRGDLKSKKAAGMFTRKGGDGKDPKTAKDPRIMLQDAVIKDPQQYATVLAHELSHAMEFYIHGNTTHTLDMFDLTAEEKETVTNELKRVVDELEGASVAQARPEYFYKPTEMLARYVEMMVLFPGKVDSFAPITTQKFDELRMREPMIEDLLKALDDSLDKGFKNYTPSWLKDLRQIYRQQLDSKHVGDIAYNAEIIRRAEVQRSVVLIDNLVKRKFKNVKDDGAALFNAAEAILVTQDGEPQFGTHDFLWDVKERDLEKSLKAGYEVVNKKPIITPKMMAQMAAGETPNLDNIKHEYDLSKVRYTPSQAKEIFEELSPAGQQLIKDFTAAKEETKDEFNRELMKQLYHIDSKVEGWVHHYWDTSDGKKSSGGSSKGSLRKKIAAAKKQRMNAEGYVEDFRKAIEKAWLELDRNEINNSFIRDQLARISKPIAKGQKPDKGWVEVVADEKGGLRLPGEGMQVMIKPDEGKAVRVPQKRYQVPAKLAKHYRDIRDVPEEINLAAKVLNRLAKYWTLNVLVHPGTVSTNFISGGLQYGAKILDDFYLDVMTPMTGMAKTRRNLIAPLKVLTPNGWTNAPDWLYGGYRSGTQGGYMADMGSQEKIDRGLESYGNKMLKAMSLVETYWKKTIALAEGSDLATATNRRVTDRLHKDEVEMVKALNEAIDTYAFDYDNKPLWLSKFDRGGGKILKPFMTYPYKLAKFYAGYATAGFDRSLPVKVRMAKVLTLTTLVAAIAMMYDDRDEKRQTPEGTEKTPLGLMPGGRVFIGTAKSGQELFVRSAKYPFFNLTSMGKAVANRNGTEIMNLLNEQIGSIGPGLELFMLATGRRDQFSQYATASSMLGEMAGSFMPGFRVLNDAGKLIDEKSRKADNFVQGVAGQLPIWGSEETRAKWRGEVRTIKIPDETEAQRSINKNARTITEREITNNQGDVLLSLLTGVYIRRIDPKEAKAQEIRELRDVGEKQIRDALEAGKEGDAEALAEEYGFEIPNGTFKYYRSKKKNESQED